MPFPDILKRRISKTSTPEKSNQQSATKNKLQRPQKLPLEGIEKVDILRGQEPSEPDLNATHLVTCLDDILFRNVALGYFLQHLESEGHGALMKFWLDTTSFKAASITKRNDIISPGCDSLDSGIASDLSTTNTKPLSNLSNLTEDAVQIYQRYVSPDCPYPVELSLEQKQDIVRGICSEDGQVEGSCFDAVKDHIYRTLERQHYAEFLRSAYYAKHQLEVLSSNGGVTIKGVLNHDVLLFHFMEFMENEGRLAERALVEFWMTAKNFAQNSEDTRQSDAMLIYEKFISLQASNPLGVNSQMRSKIEEAICSRDGHVKADCFAEVMETVESVLETNYLKPFCASALFSKYFAGLISTIEKAGVNSTTPSRDNQIRQRSFSGSSLNTTCSSETISSSQNISTRNTLLASTSNSGRKSKRSRKGPADFLDRANQPDFLWRRQQSILTNIGHVDHLGRYISCLELPPDTTQKRPVFIEPNMKSRISKVVRKIITNDDVERLKEEMAWQMAELVISDVINRTKFPPISDEEALSNLGAPSKMATSAISRKIST